MGTPGRKLWMCSDLWFGLVWRSAQWSGERGVEGTRPNCPDFLCLAVSLFGLMAGTAVFRQRSDDLSMM